MQKATIDDVAAPAGVSIKTVSRVVNKEPNVRERTIVETTLEILVDQVRSEPAIDKLHTIEAELRLRESTEPAKSRAR